MEHEKLPSCSNKGCYSRIFCGPRTFTFVVECRVLQLLRSRFLGFDDECHEIRSVLMGVQDVFVLVDFSQLPSMATPSSWILTACKDEKHSRVEGHRYVSQIDLLSGALSWFGRLVFCGVCVIKFQILSQHLATLNTFWKFVSPVVAQTIAAFPSPRQRTAMTPSHCCLPLLWSTLAL